MQISRHWRLNAQRYRLEGVRYENGQMSLQDRPVLAENTEQVNAVNEQQEQTKAAVTAA